MERDVLSIINKGKALKVQIGKLVRKYEYSPTNNNILLLGYYDIMIEHHSAIHLLTQKRLFGSVFSLLRAFYEPLYRALWVNGCATDAQIDRIIGGKDAFPKMNKIAEQIDRAYRTDDFWRSMKTNLWPPMNDYTHSGMRQVSRRFTQNEVTPNYNLRELVEVLNGINFALLFMALLFFTAFGKADETKVIRRMLIDYTNKQKNR